MSKRLDAGEAQDPRCRHSVRRAARSSAARPSLAAVLAVVYLVFNQGWAGGRVDLAAEAIRLGRALAELMPDEGEVLALLVAHAAARRASRGPAASTARSSCSTTQDRALWDEQQLGEAAATCCSMRLARGAPAPYARPGGHRRACTSSGRATGSRSPRSDAARWSVQTGSSDRRAEPGASPWPSSRYPRRA